MAFKSLSTLRIERLKRGLDATDVAKSINVKYSRILKLESSENILEIILYKELLSLANLFKISVDELISILQNKKGL